MKSINDIRKENLREILERDFDGTQTRLAERMGTQPNLVSRWVNGQKSIGNAVARKIEDAARKPAFWLDTDHIMEMESGAAPGEGETEIGKIVAGNLQRWMDGSRALSSQQRVADKSGVSQATINRLLRNEASITLNNLAAIAAAFGRRPYELLIPPNDTAIIGYDHSRYAELPLTEKAKIQSFIEFVFTQNPHNI